MPRWLPVLLATCMWATSHHRLIAPPASAAEPLWQQLVPRQRVEADAGTDYTLKDENGPWLILAASFSGPQGEDQARELVMEIRSSFQLPAYYYAMTSNMRCW